MNKFQKDVLDRFPSIEYNDFVYFTSEAEEKVKALGLPKKDCSINDDVFVGCNEDVYHRRAYCLKNCGLKCLI